MRKKYLSALLFGAILFTPVVTFTSCSDYDDDIASLQSQITSLESSISTLQSQVDAGNYVTAVSGSGTDINFTFSDGSTTTITVDNGSEAQVVTISDDGELLIDGEGTGIFASTENGESGDDVSTVEEGVVKVQDGTWWVMGEDGEYADTGIPVSGVTVVGNDEEGYTLTIYASDGTTQEIFVAGAASLITSIDVEDGYPKLQIIKAIFDGPDSWAGPKTLPSKWSVIYSSNSDIAVRINPVDAPATEVTYTLVNSKNQELSNIELTATADNSLLTTDNANGRAAGTSNGLYVLNMEDFTLTESAASTFETNLADKKALNDETVFAVNANVSTRSNYAVVVPELQLAEDLDKIEVTGSGITGDVEAEVGSTDNEIEVTVGLTYTIDVPEDAEGALYDMYFVFGSGDIKTYGITYDNEARTFTVGTDPDLSTVANGFDVTVYTLDTKGNVATTTYTVTLNSDIVNTDYTYAAVTYDISQLTNSSNDGFTIDLTEFKAGLGDSETSWINRVEINRTTAAIYSNSACTSLVDNGILSLDYDNYLQADGTTAASTADNLQNIVVNVDKNNSGGLTLDTQYYLKVTFNTNGGSSVNSIVVPVTFTAPSVSDQFTPDANFVVDDVITAYYYEYEYDSVGDVIKGNKDISIKRYFTAYDEYATLALDASTTLVDNYTSNNLADLSEPSTIANDVDLKLNTDLLMNDGTGRELGYGKELIVTATNANYADTGWAYSNSSDSSYTFTITVLSPIFEGVIAPISGSAISVIANSEAGYAITGDMIELTDYNGTAYSVVPDDASKGVPTNEATNGNDAWSAQQITNVYVEAANTEYIPNIELRVPDSDTGVEGAIMVYATPMPNTTDTSITVYVKDVWGYTTSAEVDVTIQVN